MPPQRSAVYAVLTALSVAVLPVEIDGLRQRRHKMTNLFEEPTADAPAGPAPAGEEIFNKEHKMELPGKDLPGLKQMNEKMEHMNVTYESLFAIAFVAIITAAPLFIAYFGDEDGERAITNIVQAVIVMVLLIGGIWAFTNVIKFQSAHFPGDRCLSMVESVYLLAQMITTVGYGDITPAFPRGQVVVGFYVLCCIMLIADMVGQVSTIVVGRVEQYSEELAKKVSMKVGLRRATGVVEDEAAVELYKKPSLSLMPIVASALTLTCFVTAGVFFWHFYPGEEKTWLQAIYMSIITLSTVGFGAFTASTEGGKVFGAFWMIFGVAALVSFVSSFTEVMMKIKEKEKYSEQAVWEAMESNLHKVLSKASGQLDHDKFMKFCLLQLGQVSEEALTNIDAEFDRLQPVSGRIQVEKLEAETFPARPAA